MSDSRSARPDADLTELVEAARRGDDRAFAELVARFQRFAVGLALGWLGDVELARDAAQEAFLDAHLHLRDLRDADAFVPWFRRVVAKHCDRLTRRAALPVSGLSAAEMLAAETPEPTEALERRDEARAVRAALERLPRRERVVVALQYLGGYGQPAIARALDLPLTTVKKRAHDARARLRKELTMVRTTLQAEGTTRLEPFSDQVELFLAIRRGDAAAVGTLLARRPDLVAEHEGWAEAEAHRARLPYARHATPLIRAAERGDLAIVKLLVEAGAPVDDACGCSTGETALWAAAVTDYPDVVAYLLERGADPDGRGALGHTALHVAAMRGWPGLARTLLAHGADPTAKDQAGRTPLDWADLKGHPEVAALLRAASPAPRATEALRQEGRAPAAPETDLCETGIKLIDLFAPIRHGDLVFVDGDHGLGLIVLLGELTLALREGGYGHALWTGYEQPILNRSELDHALGESGRRDMARLALVPAGLEPGEADAELARILDRWQRETAGEARVVVLFQAAGHAAAVEALQPRLTRRGAGAVTAFVVASEQFPPRGATRQEELPPGAAAHLRFDPARPLRGLFPALKATALASANLAPTTVGAEHASAAAAARALLARYERIDPDLAFPDPASLPSRQRATAARAQRLHAYLSQPLFFGEPFTGKPGVRVPRGETIRTVARILDGQMDAVPVRDLYMTGA